MCLDLFLEVLDVSLHVVRVGELDLFQTRAYLFESIKLAVQFGSYELDAGKRSFPETLFPLDRDFFIIFQ